MIHDHPLERELATAVDKVRTVTYSRRSPYGRARAAAIKAHG
jgi:hypothetical protein